MMTNVITESEKLHTSSFCFSSVAINKSKTPLLNCCCYKRTRIRTLSKQTKQQTKIDGAREREREETRVSCVRKMKWRKCSSTCTIWYREFWGSSLLRTALLIENRSKKSFKRKAWLISFTKMMIFPVMSFNFNIT